MEIRKEYKHTEVGIIPEDWEVKELGEIISSYQLGGNYPNGDMKTNFPLMKMGNLNRGDINLEKIQFIKLHIKPSENDLLYYGDVLFNTRNTLELVGKVAIWRSELPVAYFNSNIMRFKFNEKFISSNFFMNLILNTKYSLFQLKGIATGTTSVAAIYTRDLVKIKVPLPTKAEQTAIAAALSDADALITQLEKLIAKKRNIKQGAMQELLTGKKRLPGFENKKGYKQTEVGIIPSDWEVKQLNQLVEFTNGKAHENSIKDVGRYIVVNSKFISTEGENKKYSDNCFCPTEAGNILFVMSDVPNGKAIAKFFFVDKNNCYAVNQRICSLKVKFDDPKFLFFVINRNKYYLTFDDGVKQTNLRKDDVLGCPIPLPPTKAEQTAIAQVLNDMD